MNIPGIKNNILTLLPVSGGILAAMAWSSWCPGIILLVAFVPFFITENHLYENHNKYTSDACFFFMLPGFIIFNLLTLGWVRAVSLIAALVIIAGMSLLMSFLLSLAHKIRIRSGNIAGITALLSLWLAFEYLSLNSFLLSPWVNLGNGLAKDIRFIQWYELTGTGGGTLWILSSNILLTSVWVYRNAGRKVRTILTAAWTFLILIPVSISLIRYYTIPGPNSDKFNVVIIQPDMDPFTEKFTIPFDVQLNKVLEMAEKAIDEGTDWIITPETLVDDPVNEQDIQNNKYIATLKEFAGIHPGINLVTGMVTFLPAGDSGNAPFLNADNTDSSGIYYTYFNSALKIDTGNNIDIYHKSKLVTGFELQISTALRGIFSRILPDLGGTTWGYGTQEERECFIHSGNSQVIAPVICYESVFGNYVADYVRKGAGALFIITNDGWWKNTNGYKHHLHYASLRAIETRRPVARAANTGISCITDIRGKRLQETGWWEESTLRGEIFSSDIITPYVRYGDLLLKIAPGVFILVLAFSFIVMPLFKKK